MCWCARGLDGGAVYDLLARQSKGDSVSARELDDGLSGAGRLIEGSAA